MSQFAVLATESPRGITGEEYRARLPTGVAYMQQLQRDGVVEHAWVRVGASGGLFIINAASHEELLAALYGNPISPHLSFEVVPLAPFMAFDGGFTKD